MLISGLFAVGLLLLPFSYASYNQFDKNSLAETGVGINLMAAVQNSAIPTSGLGTIWQVMLKQIDGVLSFTAQAIEAVGDAPGELFNVISNDPPGSAGDLPGSESIVSDENLLPSFPAPQAYDGTLLFNVPVIANNDLSVQGQTNLNDLSVSGEFSITDLNVPGVGTLGSIIGGGTQLGSLNVAGNTQLNTLSVTGPVNFSNLNAGVLTVSNSFTSFGNLSAFGGITTGGNDVDLQGGEIFAANIINEIIAGDNIDITGTPSAPIISADVPSLGSRVRRINGISGNVDLLGSGGITITESGNDITITNASGTGTFLGLSDTPSTYTANAIQFANNGATALTQSAGLIFDGTNLVIGSTTAQTELTVNGDASVVGQSAVRFYETDNSNYVGFRASSTLAGDVIWTLPEVDGSADQILTTDGTGNLAFQDLSSFGVVTVLGDLSDVTLTATTTGDILTFNGSQWINATSGGLGLGDGTFLGLTDTSATYTASAIQFANSGATALTQSANFVFDGSSVGIGTSTPSQKLHLYDSSSATLLIESTSGDALLDINASNGIGDYGAITFYKSDVFTNQIYTGSDTDDNLYIDTSSGGTYSIFEGAGVGIGTTTPTTALSVDGDVSIADGQTLRLYDSNSSNYIALRASTSLASNYTLTLPIDDGLVDQVLVTDGSGILRFSDVTAVGGGVSRWVDLSDTPAAFVENRIPFMSSTSVEFSSQLAFNGVGLSLGTATATDDLTVHGSVFIGSNGSTPGFVYSNGDDRVGIGTDSPNAKLTVENGTILQRGAESGDTYTPTSIASIDLADTANDAFVIGTMAYVVSGSFGDDFHVIDISERTNPTEVGSVDLPASANDLYVSGNYAYVVTDVTGTDFHVIDIKDSSAPSVAGSLGMVTSARGVAVQGRYAYITTADSGDDFHIVDISDPTLPVEVGSTNLPTSANSVAVSGDYAYVVTESASRGFHIFDISDPTSPTEVASSSLPANANDVEVRGSYVFIATGSSGDDFHIFDVSDPTSPTSVGSLGLSAGANDLSISGAYAYVTTQGTGDDLHVIDISDPTTPVEVGSEEVVSGTAVSVSVAGRYGYITSSATGDDFLVFDLTGIDAQTILANSLESGKLNVLGDIVAGGSLSLAQGLRAGGAGIQTDGSLFVAGTDDSIIMGNLGIGTTSASHALTVGGLLYVDGNGTSTFTNNLQVSGNLKVGTSSLIITTNGIRSSGDLVLEAGAGGSIVFGDQNATSTFSADSQLGRVGIGTTTPTEVLTVDGDAWIRGLLYDYAHSSGTVGDVLTRTANGLEWVSTSSLNISGSGGGSGQGLQSVQTFTSGGTWTKPAGVDSVMIYVTGGGGGGGGTTDLDDPGNGGGASGGTAITFLDVSAISSATITVGGGGSGNADGTGTAGSNSSWADGTNTITGNGGAGGAEQTGFSTAGVGGTGGSASSGDINVTGGDGSSGSMGNSDTSIQEQGGTGGDGGASYWGGGGRGGNNSSSAANGTAGSAYGSGGGGGNGDAGNGAAGADGIIVVYEYTSQGGADLAELYPSSDNTIGAGDIVFFSTEGIEVAKAVEGTDKSLAGVVSTDPGIVLSDDSEGDNAQPVALAGRIPTKVNLEGGPIFPGDRIAPSGQPGVGRKANEFEPTVGTAVTAFMGSGEGSPQQMGLVTVFVDMQEGFNTSHLTEVLFEQSMSTTSELLGFDSESENTIWKRLRSLAASFVDGVLAVIGIEADRVKTSELCVDDVCVDADDLRALLELTSASSTTPPPEPEEEEPVEPPAEEPDPEPESEEEEEPVEPPTEDSTEPGPTSTSTATSTDEVISEEPDEMATSTPEMEGIEPESGEETEETTDIEAGAEIEEDEEELEPPVEEPAVEEGEETEAETEPDTIPDLIIEE